MPMIWQFLPTERRTDSPNRRYSCLASLAADGLDEYQIRDPMSLSRKYRAHCLGLFLLGAIWSQSCTPAALNNLEAPTSNLVPPTGVPVARTILVGFVNNTPFRAIFTFGAYDQLNEDAIPTGFGQLRLEGNTASAQQPQPCRKLFSVGGE